MTSDNRFVWRDEDIKIIRGQETEQSQDDETKIDSTVYRCPSCGGSIHMEVIRPEGGGDPESVTYRCASCRKSFTEDELRQGAEEA